MVLSEKSLTLSIDGKDRTIFIDVDDDKAEQDTCVVIGHGASGDATSGNLPKIAKALAEEGHTVIRYNAGGQVPARCKLLQGILNSKHEVLGKASSFILSGHSMGGRTACAVARERSDVRGVLLLSFPLHPPGKPDQLRDEDLVALEQPVMIVRGSKDAFSTEGPFTQVIKRMKSKKLCIVDVEGGDHSLGTKNAAGEKRFAEWIGKVQEFVKELTDDKDWKPGSIKASEAATKGVISKKKEKQPSSEARKDKKASESKADVAKSKGGVSEKAGKSKDDNKSTTGTTGSKAGRKSQPKSSPKKGSKRQKIAE